MLLQSHLSFIHLLPALPEAWQEGSIKGILARGGFVIDIFWLDGQLSKVAVHSLSGRNCRIFYQGQFLDFPTEICLEGIKKRMGKARTDMPWIETEEDREFLTFVENFSRDTRPQILDILNRHPEKRIIIFKDRSYADDFLEQMKNQG